MVSRSTPTGRFIRMAAEIERFFALIDLSAGPGFCNPWTGGTFDSGYPRFALANAKRSSVRAHRYGWKLLRGPIPPRMIICHSCDFRPCMNPLHWSLGTNASNSAEMVARGRSLPGSSNPAARLTEADVRIIKYELLPQVAIGKGSARRGQLTMRQIATRYGVTDGVIMSIRAGRTWGQL